MTTIRTFALAVFLVGCGGTSADDPKQACDDLASSLCDRFYACLSTAELQAAGLPATEPACVTMYEQQLGCGAITPQNACPSGKAYHPDQANLCIDQVGGLACADLRSGSFDVNTSAPACGAVCM